MDANIEYEVLADKSYLFYNIPDGDETVTVQLRPLTRRDRSSVPADDDEYVIEKIIALMCVKWGDRQGITTLDLLDESKDEAVIILGQAFQTFFQPRVRFSKRT